MSKLRLINISLFLSVLICYLEWSGGNSGFIFQMELDILRNQRNSNTFLHPVIFVPLAGQILLLTSILRPKKMLTLCATILLLLLVLLFLLVGVLAGNIKMILSDFPFLTLSIYFFFSYRKFN